MKQLFTSLAILFITCSALAQEKSKFQSAMEGSLQKMEKAKTPEEYQSVANTLARIAENEKTEWAPMYYATFIRTFQAFEAKDKAAAANQLELLTPELEKLMTVETVVENDAIKSEIHTLLAMMYSARMMENPMALGAKFGPINSKHLLDAIALNEANPRAYLLLAQSLFYTPEEFGGDKAKAKELATKAHQLFVQEAELENNNYMPRWGSEQAEGLLKQMK